MFELLSVSLFRCVNALCDLTYIILQVEWHADATSRYFAQVNASRCNRATSKSIDPNRCQLAEAGTSLACIAPTMLRRGYASGRWLKLTHSWLEFSTHTEALSVTVEGLLQYLSPVVLEHTNTDASTTVNLSLRTAH